MFDPEKRARHEISGSLIYSGRRKGVAGDTYLPADARSPEAARRAKASFLDSEQAERIHVNLMGHYIRELDRQAENRLEMALDEDFYDHIQFTDEELQILAARGQAPLVFNMIQTSVNWVLGTQRRAPMDYRVLSRKKAGTQAAERKTQLLKHVSDANGFDHVTSDAFASAVKAGLGWLEGGQAGPDTPGPVMLRSESWRSMLWDSTSTAYDMQDARYLMRSKWLDADIAHGMWPDRRGLVERSISQASAGLFMLDELGDEPMDHAEAEHFGFGASRGHTLTSGSASRDRVRVIECWFKRVVGDAAVIRGGQFAGELFDPWSPGHVGELNAGLASLSIQPRQIVHVALFTDAGLLDIRRSPYRHNRYPFTPIWGYRRARDGMPYGLIRGVRDIQRDLNRRAAKALHHLSTTRVTVQEGAVDDIETLRDEAGRPDAVIEYKSGQPAPVVQSDTNIAAAHIDLMSRDAQMIQSIGGVTDENMGRSTNAKSGKAIIARQDQGALATSTFFDNLRRSRQIHGEKTIILCEQFYTEADEIRITDARGNPAFVPINDGAPENAIAAFKADFVLGEEEWRLTVRQAQAEALLDLGGRLAATAPQIVVQMLDLIVEAMDVPKRDELVKRIRQITGVEDPDADPNNPTPEQMQMAEQKAQAAEMQKRQAMAALAEVEAKARKITAEASKAEAATATDLIAQMTAAMEAALQIAGAPAVAAAADQILGDARLAAGLPPDMAAQGAMPPVPTAAPPATVPPVSQGA
ncbi:portal protein [Frigidibacter oleivorans]|uniref:portal protein n=1 Tax=Frigidibacter oleivorans TaxID=2487129 RepID=UPI000F8C8865|nr:hypothetical protein [Frigidibacter oleivorans]